MFLNKPPYSYHQLEVIDVLLHEAILTDNLPIQFNAEALHY